MTQRLGHGENYKSGFQPSTLFSILSWGFAPGWYQAAPLALISALAMATIGCNSAPTPSTPAQSAIPAYPPRPTTPPPPVKLFHTTDNTLTLVTTPNATDDELAALVYQLRDATHAHTLDTLHLPEKLVDARSPIVWFHIYRGPKCASEKYTTAALPCGPSYHGAAEYTIGSFHDPNHDQGSLDIDENHQRDLWNPDAPSTGAAH